MPVEVACGKVTPGIGPVGNEPKEAVVSERRPGTVGARVGHEAPDFKAEGYFQGTFQAYQLSEFRGHWVLLCFYPGDFTFV